MREDNRRYDRMYMSDRKSDCLSSDIYVVVAGGGKQWYTSKDIYMRDRQGGSPEQ